ncbi:MAG: putative collagen-binding domain-containing protein, partial [Bacteroidota bacterium]
PFHVVLGKIAGNELQAYWYNPRTGKSTDIGNIPNKDEKEFTPPSSGYGQDWVLVLDDASKKYAKP